VLNGTNATTIGIYIGGLATCAPVTSCPYGDHQSFNNLKIHNWGTGIQWGVNAFQNWFITTNITNNQTGLFFPTISAPNSGEAEDFIGSIIANNVTGMNLVGFSDFYFYGGSCDYNNTCGNVNAARFYGMHFEQHNGIILSIQGSSEPHVEIIGGWAQLIDSGGTDAEMFLQDATGSYFKIDGTFLFPGHATTNIVNLRGSLNGGVTTTYIRDMPYSEPVQANITSYLNIPCDWTGCAISGDNLGHYAYASTGSAVTDAGAARFSSYSTGFTSGVSCPGAPTSSFASINGIVTHC
jgi:hypothetical protein